MKEMKCPSCGANISVDERKEYGQCQYCGSQIKTKEIIEIKHSGKISVDGIEGFEQLSENGKAYLAMKDFGRAEIVYKKIIKDYPAQIEGYKGLITAYARNFERYDLFESTQFETLLSSISFLMDENDVETLEFISKTNKYIEKLGKAKEINEKKDKFVNADKRITNGIKRIIVLAVLLAATFATMYFTESHKDIVLYVALGICALIVICLLILVISVKQRSNLGAEIKKEETALENGDWTEEDNAEAANSEEIKEE